MKKYTKLDRKKLREKYKDKNERNPQNKPILKKKYKREKFKPNFESTGY